MLEETFQDMPENIVDEYRKVMGISLTVSGYTLKLRDEWLILLGCGMIFLVIGMAMMKSKRREL